MHVDPGTISLVGREMMMKNNEWFTPGKYIEAARQVMGSIELDPASCSLANETVKATKYYTKEDNGFDQDWTSKSLWLNPPFNRSQTPGHKINTGYWVRKLVREYEQGNVIQAVLLCPNRADTSWFQLLWEYPICFPRRKVGFYVPSRKQVLQECCHSFGTIFVYFGTNEQKFIDIFSQFGRIARAIDTPRQQHVNLELWGGVV